MEDSSGQSINLALSFRGREALRAVGLEDILVKQHGTCMRGRMLHDKNGNLKEVLYDSVKGNVSLRWSIYYLELSKCLVRNFLYPLYIYAHRHVNCLFCSASTPLAGDILIRFYWMVRPIFIILEV